MTQTPTTAHAGLLPGQSPDPDSILEVPVEPREPYDGFAKDWIAHQLVGCGSVTINAPFQPEKLYIDVLHVPTSPPPNPLLAQMVAVAQRAVLFEPFQKITRHRLRDCVSKCTSYNALISDKKDEDAQPLAAMWVISAFDSRVKGDFNFEPDARWDAWGKQAFFKTGDGTNLYFVCLSRLHATPDTLPLRLLGRGATLRDALDEATTHGTMDPKLKQLVRFWGLRGKKTPSQWSQEMTAHVYKIVEEIRQELRDEGRQEGRAAPLVRALGRKLGAPLSEQEREVVLGRLAQVDDDTLADLIADVLGGRVQPVVHFLGLQRAVP